MYAEYAITHRDVSLGEHICNENTDILRPPFLLSLTVVRHEEQDATCQIS